MSDVGVAAFKGFCNSCDKPVPDEEIVWDENDAFFWHQPCGSDSVDIFPEPLYGANTLDAFQDAFSAWAFETFENQSVRSKLTHLKKEIDETIDNPGDINEWADQLLLYANAAKLQGFSFTQILAAARAKWMNDLVHREWLPPDEDGCVHHVKKESA